MDLKGKIESNTTTVGTVISNLQQWIGHPDRKSIRKHWT